MKAITACEYAKVAIGSANGFAANERLMTSVRLPT
jgi:hypothetical protein